MNNDQNQSHEAPVELMPVSAVEAIERAQVDMQVATAKRYPRSIKKFLADAKSMISEDLETAESCNYKLKRKGKDGDKYIEGPSIRLLELAASAYTNIRYGSRIVGIDADFVTAQGVSHDMERNVASSVEVKRSIVGNYGRYKPDMIMVTANAAGAIARRNALNGVVPRSYVNQLSDFAKTVALGDIKTLPERRQRAFEFFTNTLRVPLARVLAYVEKASIEDCTLDDLEKLTGLKTALKEGETTLDAEFPAEAKKPVKEGPGDDGDLGPQTEAQKAASAKTAKVIEEAVDKPYEKLMEWINDPKNVGLNECKVVKYMQKPEVKLMEPGSVELKQATDANMRTLYANRKAVLKSILAIPG